jgi:hypothetical protein
MLGYPSCCQHAFIATWGAGHVDSTWEQWNATTRHQSIRQNGAHTLLRWMGIRLVPHMPCAYDCAPSLTFADKFFNLGVTLGYKDDMVLMQEVMNWPIAWSRLFGIAEIVTPAVKISTRTDWTPTKDAFTKDGHYNKPDAAWWTDNQFINPTAMFAAHDTIINSLVAQLPQKARVFDLGCGNGMLLRRLTNQRPDVKIGGIDMNGAAIKHIPTLSGTWMTGPIESFDWLQWRPDTTIISVQRLLEMSQDDRDVVIRAGGQTFIYAYPDTVKDESLETLTGRLGLTNFRMLRQTPAVSVGVRTNS